MRTTELPIAVTMLCLAACMPPAQAPEEVSVSYTVPVVSPVQAGTETQEQKGVVFRVVPQTFNAAETPKKTCTPGQSLFVTNDKKPYTIMTEPGYTVSPTTLTFVVKVTNRSNQVLKLEGTILKLNVDGKEVVLDSGSTKAFLTGILTPNEEKEFSIVGPAWNSITGEPTVAFALSGVPIDLDKAGNVAERGNFAWTYKAKLEPKTGRASKKIENVTLDPNEAKALSCPVGPG